MDFLFRFRSSRSVVAITIGAALAMGWRPMTSGAERAVGIEGQRSSEEVLRPSNVNIDGEALRISVPPAWRKVEDSHTVMFAPENGRGQVAGKAHVSYGIELGVTPTTGQDFNAVLDNVVRTLTSARPTLRIASTTRLVRLAGRLGLRGTFANRSLVTGRDEFVVVAAARVERDRALYMIGVAPDDQFGAFRPTLEAILGSIEAAR
jgi:hypothetical protein